MQNKTLKKVVAYYNKELLKFYKAQPLAVQSYIAYKRITKPRISIELKQKYISEIKDILKLNFSILSSQVDDILLKNYNDSGLLELIESFEQSLKKAMKGEKLSHVTSLDKEKLKNMLKATRNLTMYQETEGKFVFASSKEANKYRYGLRNSHGMIKVDRNTIILPSHQNLKISDKVELKKPVYSYQLDVEDFKPVFALKMDKRKVLGKSSIIPCFYFDNEWVCDKDIDLTDVVCETITDVTKALDDFEVYLSNGENIDENLLVAHKVRMSNDPQKEIQEYIANGKLMSLNEILKQNRGKNLLV